MASSSSSSSSSADRNGDDDGADVELVVEETIVVPQQALLTVAQDLFLCAAPDSGLTLEERRTLMASIQARITADDMSGLYSYLESARTSPQRAAQFRFLSELGFSFDANVLAAMQEKNKAEVAVVDAKVKEATEVAGDSEVQQALLTRANLRVKWAEQAPALEELTAVLEKTVGVASKIDVLLTKLRVSLAFIDTRSSQGDSNLPKFKADLDKAKALIEQGGDWERKNQLSVYEAVYLMVTRQFTEAAKLLLDGVATFTASEVFSYQTFVLHACVLNLIVVDRATLAKDILKSPEILSVLDEVEGLRQLLTSLHKCQYRDFFAALNTLTPSLQRSRYLAPHLKFYLRELRVVAYSQFLSSYKSASLEAMASSFGVSASFLDQELFRFISAGRIHAKIDKVAARVDTNRPDKKNQIYSTLVKDGDVLLNRLHKLSKVIAL